MLEYKFFEPAFYHTDVPDWGTSYAQVAALGDRAMVCLDTGHHAPGTNIEFIVMQLLRLGKLGSFDFNSRFYADDDLIVGAADPFQLFRIIFEVDPRRRPQRPRRRVHARPVPQHRGQDPRPDPLGAQRAGDDGAGAARRPATRSRAAQVRERRARGQRACSWTRSTPTCARRWPSGASRAACRPTRWPRIAASGYQQKIEADRVGGVAGRLGRLMSDDRAPYSAARRTRSVYRRSTRPA